MEVQPDFKELLALFNDHRVSYMIVGGYALAFYGAPRFTGDLDIFVKPDHENAQRIAAALDAFGFASLGLTADDFEQPDQVIQLGVSPVRIDLITSLTGVSWDEAFAGRASSNYGDVPVHYIGRDQFISNKRATGRTKDLADLEVLGEK
ncbi:MAG: nucleotidyl transferase AbiEii/AbiGii toxin family protein [Deltaproteobacteria bacterium]|nr:nucleotidyl transferase AbiEii/AbiGii toxin family protein [Deltaproteobacteria bacterium]MBI2366475.1 nucleotidyl transferase AbiEii/AbiGii toxin family protein [Deltaproteobacteria bacterium]